MKCNKAMLFVRYVKMRKGMEVSPAVSMDWNQHEYSLGTGTCTAVTTVSLTAFRVLSKSVLQDSVVLL